jgi:entry exclusion lipoprotein TrbK
MKTMSLSIAVGMALVLAGCDNKPATLAMPVVNNENCQLENIKQIEDKATRQEFAGMCSRRSVGPETLPANSKRW